MQIIFLLLISVLFFALDPLLFSKNLFLVNKSSNSQESEDCGNKEKGLEVGDPITNPIKEDIVSEKNLNDNEEVEVKQEVDPDNYSKHKENEEKQKDQDDVSMFAMEVKAGKESFLNNFCEIIK